jgi:hypothetical protein
MSIHTSKEGLVREISDEPLRAHLWDFDIAGDRLKPEHTKWLAGRLIDRILRIASGPSKLADWKLYLQGSASRTGEMVYNATLSRRRAESVANFVAKSIASKGLRIPVELNWVGEFLALFKGRDEASEDPTDRSVHVALSRVIPPPIPRPVLRVPKHLEPIVMPVKLFRIRMGYGGSAGAGLLITGVKVVLASFEIWDVELGLKATYVFHGAGKTIDLPGSPIDVGGEVTVKKGKWSAFIAPRPQSVDGFEGPARIGGSLSASVGETRSSATSFSFVKKPGSLWPDFKFHISELDTGVSYATPGAGYSTPVDGSLKLAESGRPFSGP